MKGPSLRVDVAALMFSGRPDPAWRLGLHDSRAFAERLDALPPADGAAAFRDGLGYRGLRAVIQSAAATRRVVIARGFVYDGIEDEAATRQRDPGNGLERWLLQTGRQSLGDDLYAYVLSAISEAR